MKKEKWGRIVLVASEDAVQPYPEEMPYCASKAGVLNLAKNLSKAYGGDGVLTNCVSPAYIETPMTDAMMEERAEELDISFEKAVETFLEEKRPNIELKRRSPRKWPPWSPFFALSVQASFWAPPTEWTVGRWRGLAFSSRP
jgi:NAD(P)-dependent dehydrogenase (short-subunit alcohol dehydrogenase family)